MIRTSNQSFKEIQVEQNSIKFNSISRNLINHLLLTNRFLSLSVNFELQIVRMKMRIEYEIHL